MKKTITRIITMMISIINKIRNIIWFILPIIYILYIVYIRLFLVRDVRMLYVKLSVTQIIITSIIIIILLLRIYMLLKKEGFIIEKQTNNNLLLAVKAKLIMFSEMLSRLWIDFLRVFTTSSLKINFILLSLLKILRNCCTSNRVLIILVIFDILPKLIILITFLIDILFFQKFYYFYKTLFLLLLPIIYSTLHAILFQYYKDNIDVVSNFINTTIVKNGDYLFRLEYSFTDDFERPAHIKDIADFVNNHYLPIEGVPYIIAYFESVKSYYKINWLHIIILILHVLGWFNILLFGIWL